MDQSPGKPLKIATLITGALQALLFLLLGRGVNLALKVVLARNLSPQEYGLLSVITSVWGVAAMLLVFGQHQGVVRYEHIEKASAKNFGMYQWSFIFVAGVSTALTILLLLLHHLNSIQFLPNLSSQDYVLMILNIPPQALILLVAYFYLAKGFYRKHYIFKDTIPALLIMIACFFLISFKSLTLTSYLTWNFSLNTAVLIFSAAYFFLRNNLYRGVLIGARPNLEFFTYSFTLLFSSISYIALGATDKIVLNFYVPEESIAGYSVVMTVGALLPLSIAAMDSFLSPKLAKHFASNDTKGIQELIYGANQTMLISGIIGVLILEVATNQVLSLFGTEYLKYSLLMIPILIVELINISFGMTGRILQLSGFVKQEVKAVIFVTLLNLILNLIFIPHYGLWGAILATVAARLILVFQKVFFVKKLVGLSFWRSKYFMLNSTVLFGLIAFLIAKGFGVV